jgi:hypothetical protein
LAEARFEATTCQSRLAFDPVTVGASWDSPRRRSPDA